MKKNYPQPRTRVLILSASLLCALSLPALCIAARLLLPAASRSAYFDPGILPALAAISALTSLLCFPLLGYLSCRLPLHTLVLFGVVLQTAAFSLSGLIYDIRIWKLLAIPLTCAISLFVYFLPPVLINRYFSASPGFSLGCLFTMSTLFSLPLRPILLFLRNTRGWRSAYTIFGILSLTALVTLNRTIFHRLPSAPQKNAPISAKKILTSHSFYMLFFFTAILTVYAVFSLPFPLSPPHTGLPVTSAYTLTLSLLGTIAGVLLLGWLCDKSDPFTAGMLAILCGIAGLCFFLLPVHTLPIYTAVLFLRSFTASSLVILPPLLTQAVFGSSGFEKTLSYVMTAIPAAFLPAFYLQSHIRNTSVPMLLLAAALTASLPLLLLLKKILRRGLYLRQLHS